MAPQVDLQSRGRGSSLLRGLHTGTCRDCLPSMLAWEGCCLGAGRSLGGDLPPRRDSLRGMRRCCCLASALGDAACSSMDRSFKMLLRAWAGKAAALMLCWPAVHPPQSFGQSLHHWLGMARVRCRALASSLRTASRLTARHHLPASKQQSVAGVCWRDTICGGCTVCGLSCCRLKTRSQLLQVPCAPSAMRQMGGQTSGHGKVLTK